jgi:hypothetical protein
MNLVSLLLTLHSQPFSQILEFSTNYYLSKSDRFGKRPALNGNTYFLLCFTNCAKIMLHLKHEVLVSIKTG